MSPTPPRSLTAVIAILAVGICLGTGRPPSPNPNPDSDPDSGPNSGRTGPSPDQASPGPRVALVAVDGADWRVIDELIGANRLPAFGRLKKGGTHGVLKTAAPLLAPVVWTTVATGRPPEDHGVLDSMVDVGEGSRVPVHGGARRVKAAWEIWSEAGRPVLVAGWPVTWPADRVRGVIASDRLAARPGGGPPPGHGLVHPPGALESISRRIVSPSSLDPDTVSRFAPPSASPDAIAGLRAALASARSWRAMVAAQLESGQPGLLAVRFDLIDVVSHLVVRDRSKSDEAIAAACEEVDGALADLAARLHPGTLVVVLSGHGFYAADAGIRDDPAGPESTASAWHRPYGVFAAADAAVVAGASGRRAPSSAGVVTPLDILPTLLARAGLPAAADMPGRAISGLAPPAPEPRVASHGPRAPSAEVPPAGMTPLARVRLARILARKGDHRGAVRELEAAERQGPLDGHALVALARGHAALGRSDAALRLCERVLQEKQAGMDAQAAALLEATTLDLQAGRLPAALDRVDRAPAALDRASEALVARGDVTEGEGRRRAAEGFYRAALNAAPSDTIAARRLIDLLAADGRADTGRMLAARLAQTYPSSPQHLALAGRASLAVKRPAEAARWFELALSLAPDDPELLELLDTARKR